MDGHELGRMVLGLGEIRNLGAWDVGCLLWLGQLGHQIGMSLAPFCLELLNDNPHPVYQSTPYKPAPPHQLNLGPEGLQFGVSC